MGDIIRFPSRDGDHKTWGEMEKRLQGHLADIFHSKEKRDRVIARMRYYHELPGKLEWGFYFKNLDIFPQEQQKAILDAIADAENDIENYLIKILRPVLSQFSFELLQKEIEHQLNDQQGD